LDYAQFVQGTYYFRGDLVVASTGDIETIYECQNEVLCTRNPCDLEGSCGAQTCDLETYTCIASTETYNELNLSGWRATAYKATSSEFEEAFSDDKILLH
jgi:hypothetical protein